MGSIASECVIYLKTGEVLSGWVREIWLPFWKGCWHSITILQYPLGMCKGNILVFWSQCRLLLNLLYGDRGKVSMASSLESTMIHKPYHLDGSRERGVTIVNKFWMNFHFFLYSKYLTQERWNENSFGVYFKK